MRKLAIVLNAADGYTIKESNGKSWLNFTTSKTVLEPTFFSGMQAEVLLGEEVIGVMGVLHPNVVNNFGWENPASVLELNIQALFEKNLKK